MTSISRISIHCNHINISVLTAGPQDGKMILLLHGFPENAESWNKQIEFLAVKGYFVVAPDQRGYAHSSSPELVMSYQLDTLALDMLFLVKHFRKEKVYLLGHDWGAVVGWYLVSYFPETFEKAVLASAPHWDVFKKHLLTHPKQILKSWYIFFIQIPFLAEIFFKYRLDKMIVHNRYPVEKVESLKKSWVDRLPTMLNWYRAMKYLLVKLPKDKISVPVHIVWGEEDPFCLKEMAGDCTHYCQNSELTIMPKLGHWPQHESTHQFNEIIDSYFSN